MKTWRELFALDTDPFLPAAAIVSMTNYYRLDGSVEAVIRVWRTAEFGFKGEIFDLTNDQAKVSLTKTTRPRNYRLITLIRF